MKTFKSFFEQKETLIGILAAAAFQIIFFCVWMTAYDGVDDRIGNISIGVVNEDAYIGEQIEQNLLKTVPFELKKYASLATAKDDMNKRSIDMVIQIPDTLSKDIQAGDTGKVIYWINEANASMAKTMMENAANQMNNEINSSLFSIQKSELVSSFQQQMPQSLPAKEISKAVTNVLEQVKNEPIQGIIEKINAKEGFAASMVPMMIVLSSFVGAMIMTMQLQITTKKLEPSFGKWSLFFSRQVIHIVTSFVLVMLTMGLMALFEIGSEASFMMIYFFQAFVFLAFLSLTQMFVALFGNAGMIFNIFALSLQLVTSSVILPKQLLASGYQSVAALLPATYAADGYYTIVFGGDPANLSANMGQLLLIIFATWMIAALAVLMKRTRLSHAGKKRAVSM
ncbi:ABC transporter permease [Bacillus sp. REN10]|uniref:YhgE/Pip domain-containing protein n=1 Tax=Bacillus sp. REN10 TaxID=2782541 RepID=UPI00193BDD6E|nr:ABC transporter permease [Bacillus sp. REN10]